MSCGREGTSARACHTRSPRPGSSSARRRTPPFVVERSYLVESSYELVSDRDGIRFTFASHRYPLESYSRALEDAGLVIEALREPPLPAAGEHRRTRLPLFLLWRAAKRDGRA